MMIASSLTPPPLNNTCSVFGLTTTRSIVQRLMGAVGRRAPEAATTPPLDAPANFSVYEPVISKLLAKVSPSAAPFSNARVVGCPRLKGTSHAETVASTDATPPQGLSLPGDSRRPPAGKPKGRTAHLFGRDYRVILPSIRDPRLHVAAVLLTLQVLGQTVLGFRLSVAQILACLLAGALIEFVVSFFKDKAILWPASGLLTGNSTAFILRVPGTLHGQWWSTHGIEIFIGVVALGMATKYLIRWRGRHIFNPSNVALVVAFVILGVQHTEPLDLWWIPMGPWMILTYAILIGGGLLIAWELKLIGLELGFMAAFAAFVAIALVAEPDHCMVASWHVTPMCGRDLWQILVTSPEILIFALFMVPDPRTVPDGQVARAIFGVLVALLSVLLLGPTTLEFWTKTAILASLVIACAGRFALARFVAPLDVQGDGLFYGLGRMGWRVPAE